MQGHRLTGFDGLRAIAALSILLFHLLSWQTGVQRGNAYLAVDFFFMLSGYVMARTYERKLADGLSPATFIAARVIRFWPTMFLAGLIGLPWFLVSNGADQWVIALTNLMLIPTFQCLRLYPLNGPAWSILLELIANALHALVLRRLPTAGLLIIAALMTPLLAIAARRYSFDVGARSIAFLPALARVLLSYVIGIILWRWWRDKPEIRVAPALALLTMPIFFGATTWFAIDNWQSGLLFILIACPLMLAGGLRWTGESRWMTQGGAMSFPLYAFHTPVCMTVILAGLPLWWGAALSVTAAYMFTRWRTPLSPAVGWKRVV
ncbi:MAG: acyltransferase [bacterium]|nr:acyltransferase [bacterium]